MANDNHDSHAVDLPAGWTWVTFGEVFDIQGGSQPDKGNFIYEPLEGYVRLLQIRDFGNSPVPTYVPRDMVTKFCKKDDIFVARYGASLGRILTGMDGAYNVALAKVIFDDALIASRYVFYLLQTSHFQTPIHMISRSAQNGFNKGDLFPIKIPLAPLLEQHRIVAKIEEQFTRLDAGITALKRAQANLKRYKAAVLKAACEGRLVAQDAAADASDEPASELLKRILAERRAKWAADLRAKGKDPQKAKYDEPQAPDLDELPELPQGWCWASVEQVCDRIVDCLHSTANFQESGFYCVDSNCIKPGRIVLEKVRYVDEPTFIERNRRMKPQEDDVIFSREGALLGIAVRVPAAIEFCLGQRMMIFRLSKCIDARYYENVLNSLVFRAQYIARVTGTASPHLNIEDTRQLAIPMPPLAEQRRIVAEVERRLSVVQELDATLTANLARAERLRQSILKRAFEGKLG